MPVEAVFTVTGRGVVLAGWIRTGVLRVGQEVEVWDGDEPVTDAVSAVSRCSPRTTKALACFWTERWTRPLLALARQ
jgi:translation elongation factor EF-Tu-like GTPase